MDWIERLNAAVDYIEDNLTGKIDFDKAARIAACSGYHFQRMFSYMADMTLSEYIRRRRMTKAALDLFGGEKVVDVALTYGYDSPTAFNRAFKSVHGIAPSQVKRSRASMKSFMPIRFALTVKGAMEMNVKLVKKEAFRVVGISENITRDVEKNFTLIPPMWERAIRNGTIDRLCACMNAEPKAVLGLSLCSDDNQWKYAIGVAGSAPTDGVWEEFIVPAATWAIFGGKGSKEEIQEIGMRIHTEWLPASGYEFGNGPEIEVYYSPDPGGEYEFWLPVVAKSRE